MIEDVRMLREGFVPSDVVHRGAEINALSLVLEPVTDGHPAEPALVTGPSGTGKTTVTKFVIGRLRGIVLNVESFHVNSGSPTHDSKRSTVSSRGSVGL